MDKVTLDCSISEDLFEQFNLALVLNKASMEDVVKKLVASYISESFINAAENLTSTNDKPSVTSIRDRDFAKANRKIPAWASRENQNNHKIIKAFLQIQEEQGGVRYDELVKRCSDETRYPGTYVVDFKGNYAQMKTDAGNSHGKVFVIENDKVVIWNEIMGVFRQYREKFYNSNKAVEGTVKITNRMSEKVYEIAKMVYQGNLSRIEAIDKIFEETKMNAGSVGDYISNYLAMMDGKLYKRTMNTYATKYFLENIRSDYGEEQFQKALNATREHVKYYNGLNNGILHSIQNVIDELR